MNFEEAFQVADAAVYAKEKSHLTDVQVVVLRGSWQDQTYEEIAEASRYSAKYLKQDAGSQLWERLSEALGERVSKTNFKAALERRSRSQNPDFVGLKENLVPVEPLSPEPPAGPNPIPTTVVERELPVPVAQVPLDSAFAFYVERSPIESICYQVISQPGGLLRIKAPSRMGKTSLMSKVLNHAANHGCRTVASNLRLAESPDFTNLDQFLRWFCNSISVMQELPNNMVDEHWDKKLGNSKLKCTSYFQEYLLALDSPLVLALDEVDRVFPYPTIAGDFLDMLRTWNESAKTKDIWKRLRLILVHIKAYTQLSLNQSPFNVGTEIELPELTREQVCDLVQMNELDLDTPQVDQLMDIVSGLPYLVQQAVSHLRTHKDTTLQQLLATAHTSEGIYARHLQRLLLSLQQQPELFTALRQVVTATSPVQLNSEQASELHNMGVVHLQGNQVTPSCELYRQYLCDQLGVS